MKRLFSFLSIAAIAFTSFQASAQDKSTRPSPPAVVNVKTSKGATITIDYSQPSVKGRTIGKEIAPYGKVWRTGANEATTFSVDKDVKINGKTVKAGKYGLYTIPGENEWTIILNNKSTLWGSDGYSEADDALRFVTKAGKASSFTEKMTIAADPSGKVSLMWGDTEVGFKVD